MIKIGSKVDVFNSRDMFDADGKIIGETKIYWIVMLSNFRVMDKRCENQEPYVKYFHKELKKGGMRYEKGFSNSQDGDSLIMLTK